MNAPDHFDSASVQEAADETANPAFTVEAAMAKLITDPGALFDEATLDAIRTIRSKAPDEYARLRAKAKDVRRNFSVTELDKLTKLSSGDVDESVINKLVMVATTKCKLSHDKDRRGIAIVDRDGHREVWCVGSSGFREWLRGEYFSQQQAGVGDPTLNSAISTINAIGLFGGEEVEVHTRYSRQDDGYYVDLCDDRWRAVRVTATGWQIIDRPPVLFTRTTSMRSLPEPQGGGDIDLLWRYVNIEKGDRLLVLAWIIECCRPDTPFPILEMIGEQGSAKSSSQTRLRALIDPNVVALRGRPKSVEDIYIAANNGWLVSYENLSGLTAEQQDACCTLATGGGFATRRFYTNDEEHVMPTKRPIALNGISVVATRPDMIDRTIHLQMPLIASDQRREESEIHEHWQKEYPILFGAVLDIFTRALSLLPTIVLPERRRMADFERLGEAVARSTGSAEGAFLKRYGEAVMDGIERALESSPVACALELLLNAQKGGTWSGTVQDLLFCLNETVLGVRAGSHWPRSAKGLSDQLRRLAPALRGKGIVIEYDEVKSNRGRRLTLHRDQLHD